MIYKAGLNHVGAYQVSSIPYITSSLVIPSSGSGVKEVQFPAVTKFLVVKNTTSALSASAPIRVGFSENGVLGTTNNNYVILDNGESLEVDFKVINVYMMSDVLLDSEATIVAGISGIERSELLTNWSGSEGVG